MANRIQDSGTLVTANIATGVTAGTGMISFLNENAGAISVMIAFASLLIALVFYILNYRLKAKASLLHREEIISELVDQMKSHAQEQGLDTSTLIEVAGKVRERRHRPKV